MFISLPPSVISFSSLVFCSSLLQFFILCFLLSHLFSSLFVASCCHYLHSSVLFFISLCSFPPCLYFHLSSPFSLFLLSFFIPCIIPSSFLLCSLLVFIPSNPSISLSHLPFLLCPPSFFFVAVFFYSILFHPSLLPLDVCVCVPSYPSVSLSSTLSF